MERGGRTEMNGELSRDLCRDSDQMKDICIGRDFGGLGGYSFRSRVCDQAVPHHCDLLLMLLSSLVLMLPPPP